ncbi:retrovirus-related pol polyprotein from transposon TNT 1-94 [Tanacetum coccineum]
MFGSDTIKLDIMDGMNFTRWNEKMKFLLTAFKVYYVLEGPPIGVMTEEEEKKRGQDETLCRGYILSTLTDRLYDLYTPMTFAREILNSLEEKYNAEKEGADKFINFKFFEFAMEDNVSILDQVHEIYSRKNNIGNDKKMKGTWNSSKNNKKDKKPLSEDTLEFQFSSGKKKKVLTLMNVLHVPNIRKNLVSGFKLCKSGVKAVIESDKVILSKANVFVGKAYACDGITAPYTSQQNGVAERKNRILQDMINAMLVSANLPKNLWGEALLTACHAPFPNTSKLGPRGLKSIFVGYAKDSKSYRCLDLDSNVIVESRDVDFFENKFRHDSTNTNEIVTQIPQDISGPNLNSNNKRNMVESSSAPRRSKRARKERNLNPDFIDSQAIIFLVEARITSIRVLFALASIYNLPIHQIDVKTAFLNGDLDEEVYMKQPEGFVFPGIENKVCKLKKSLYGLKQAPKQWHDKFDKSILSNGFTHNSSDRCIYSKFTKDYGVILCFYVDYILIVGTNIEGINESKKFMSSCFQMKDINEVDTILGIKVKRHKEANTPYESSCKMVENNGRVVAQIEYASAIGCLMYATHCTRPDIAYVVFNLSRYTSNPSQNHWKAIGRVFGYLKRTRQLALYYDRFPTVLEGYSDASWITGSSDSKSITGWIFTLGGGAVCWGSKKQTCITHSTMEAEILALAPASKEAEWLRNMLLDIELWPQPMPAISLHCDSQSTLSRAYNKVYNGKSRHISLRHAYIKELISNGIITIEYIRSCKNLADPFTKGISKDMVFGTTREMGLKPIE